jgi:hypothetical protein
MVFNVATPKDSKIQGTDIVYFQGKPIHQGSARGSYYEASTEPEVQPVVKQPLIFEVGYIKPAISIDLVARVAGQTSVTPEAETGVGDFVNIERQILI